MIGKELKEARQKLGLSQPALGAELGMSREMIGKMEHGHKSIEKRTELSIWCLLYEAGLFHVGDRAT